MRKFILNSISLGVKAIEYLKSKYSMEFIENVINEVVECYKNEGKLIIAGNGGSLCDAMHCAEELTGYFRKNRPPLPAIALCDPGHITCVSNDDCFEEIFSRSVLALGNKGDILIILTTSGNSKNLLKAVEAGKERGLITVGFLGKSGGILKGKCTHEWIVSGFSYSDRIQEAHMTAIHIIIEMVENQIFFNKE